MSTFVKQIGRLKYMCLLSERVFGSEADASAHQETLIRRLQALSLLDADYNYGELFDAYHLGLTAKSRAA